MAIGRITYADKIDYQIQGESAQNKITAQDMNQIKKVFNDSASTIEDSINTLDTAISNVNDAKKQAQASEANAKKYMDDAKASADSVLNGLGMVIVDGCICMYDEEE